MRISNLTVWRISLQHDPFQRDMFQNLYILQSFKTASIYSDIQIQRDYLLYFLCIPSKGMHYSGAESMPVFSDYLVEVISCVSVVQVKGKLIFLCYLEVKREDSQLLFLTGIVQSVIIQPALSDSYQLSFDPLSLQIQHFKILFDRAILFLVEGLRGSTRMYADSAIRVFILTTQLIRFFGILHIASSYQKMRTADLTSPFNHLFPITRGFTAAELFICEISCNVKKRQILFHELTKLLQHYQLKLMVVFWSQVVRGVGLTSRYCGRVVKAMDLKSIGFSRTGSNPVNVVFYNIPLIKHITIQTLIKNVTLPILYQNHQNTIKLILNLQKPNKFKAINIKFYYLFLIKSMMRSMNINQLSSILQKKDSEDSKIVFQSSNNNNIRCPTSNTQNYQCFVCNRLRKACPYTRLNVCPHQGIRNQSKYSNVNMNKSSLSTQIGDRNRTFSYNQSQKLSDNMPRESFMKTGQNNNRSIVHHTVVNPTEEIIYYPVIHNKIVYSPSPIRQKQTIETTPNRMKKSHQVDIDEKIILTPTQFKGLIDYLRKE